MKGNKIVYYIIAISIMAVTIGFANLSNHSFESKAEKTELILNTPFDIVMEVLTHKRCVNCHPAGDTPKQGEDSHPHKFNVLRGADDHGLAGYSCNTCHSKENNDYSVYPAAPHWAVAPIGMAWKVKQE